MKVYATEVDGLTQHQRDLVAQFGSEVGGALALASELAAREDELADRTAAMDHRRTIDLALGILMERCGCSADAAFGMLRSFSQRENVKVRVAAERVVTEVAGGAATPTSPFQLRGERPAY